MTLSDLKQISSFIFEGVAGYVEKIKAVRWQNKCCYSIKRVITNFNIPSLCLMTDLG